MSSIKETRSALIRNHIIKKEDVQSLAKAFASIHKNWKKREDKYIQFTAICDDQTKFETADPNIFEDLQLNSKRILQIEMQFQASSGADVKINLEHNPSNDDQNKIKVQGTDSIWVNGTMKKLEDMINTFTPQNVFVRQYSPFINIVFAISMGSLLARLVTWLTPVSLSNNLSNNFGASLLLIVEVIKGYPIAYYFLKYCLYALTGFLPAFFLTENIKKVWPKIEFQLGPEYKLTEKQRRRWIFNSIIIGVVPLLLQLFYDITKNFFSN